MKFFGQSEPGLILFYSPHIHNEALEELEIAFPEISNRMFVMKADLNDQMGRNLAAFCDIDVSGFPKATLKIILPGDHHQVTMRFNMPEEFGDTFKSEHIIRFTNLFFDG
jgi:hypothetical protein